MRNKDIDYFKYWAKVTEDGTPHKGYSYKTSTSLIDNIIAKKELTLFSELETDGNLAITSASKEYINQRGKRVYLTPFQMKLVTAFAQVVDTLLEQEDIKEYVNSLPFKIEERERGEDGTTKKSPNSVKCVIDFNELTKLIYSTKRIGGKQTDKVREETKALSELLQVYKFTDDRGGTLTIEAPIISLGKKIKYETKDGVLKINKVEVTFEDVFVYEINDKYSLSPITLLQLWNETGVQTELFTMLLFLLQKVRGNHITHAKKAVEERGRELRKKKVNAQDVEKELDTLRRKILTYKESITSLLERVGGNKYKDKGKYIRLNVINKDLKQATDALLKIGIISEYYETKGVTGDKVCNFVINDMWIVEEANKIKQLSTKPGKS